MHIYTPFEDPGNPSAPYPKDKAFIRWLGEEAYLGVLGPVDMPYLPKDGPRLFHGQTGAQMVGAAVLAKVFGAAADSSIKHILQAANTCLRMNAAPFHLDFKDAGTLPGTCFAVAEIRKKRTTVITGGDCMMLWQMRDGTFGGTKNRVLLQDQEQSEDYTKWKSQYPDDLDARWEKHFPFMVESYRSWRNRKIGYSFLNGQQEFMDYWDAYRLPTSQLRLLIAVTDGMVKFTDTDTPNILASHVIRLFEKDGYQGILKVTRQNPGESSVWKDYPEAAAIAVRF